MKLRIQHHTHYGYSEPLQYSVQQLLLWPADGPTQRVLSWRVDAPSTLYALPDGMGNRCHGFTLQADALKPRLAMDISASGCVVTMDVAAFHEGGDAPHPAFFLRSSPHAEPHPRMAAWARQAVSDLDAALQAGVTPSDELWLALAQAVAHKVRYRSGSTGVETTALEAFDWGLGVCQDQAHVMLAVCRSLGVSARYVSGYFYADTEPDLASHAWVDVCTHALDRRWLSIDVTHHRLTDGRYVRLAVGSDYTACPPVKGLRRGGGDETLRVSVQIAPEPD
jgi:transglutaminase-like putative cysteine protease